MNTWIEYTAGYTWDVKIGRYELSIANAEKDLIEQKQNLYDKSYESWKNECLQMGCVFVSEYVYDPVYQQCDIYRDFEIVGDQAAWGYQYLHKIEANYDCVLPEIS